MKIIRHKNFTKSFKKLPKKIQEKIKKSLYKFEKDPFAKELKNHALKGKYLGKRSISCGGDLRIIFQEKNNYIIVIIIDIVSHSQLY